MERHDTKRRELENKRGHTVQLGEFVLGYEQPGVKGPAPVNDAYECDSSMKPRV